LAGAGDICPTDFLDFQHLFHMRCEMGSLISAQFYLDHNESLHWQPMRPLTTDKFVWVTIMMISFIPPEWITPKLIDLKQDNLR
jgi:hypothetical protein